MRRTLFLTILVTSLVLPLLSNFAPADIGRAHAQSRSTFNQIRRASNELKQRVDRGRGGDLVQVIIQPASNADDSVDTTLQQLGGTNSRRFRNFRNRVVTMTAEAALALSQRDDIEYVTLNREVRALGHVSLTTGADNVRQDTQTSVGVDGSGIGIAVLDSGIDTQHRAFRDRWYRLRVVASQDFTGEGRTDDPYGHGTHVASIAAGNGAVSCGQYIGIAPNAKLINLRVLDSQGIGSTASVLSALDWVATNRELYNIRV